MGHTTPKLAHVSPVAVPLFHSSHFSSRPSFSFALTELIFPEWEFCDDRNKVETRICQLAQPISRDLSLIDQPSQCRADHRSHLSPPIPPPSHGFLSLLHLGLFACKFLFGSRPQSLYFGRPTAQILCVSLCVDTPHPLACGNLFAQTA